MFLLNFANEKGYKQSHSWTIVPYRDTHSGILLLNESTVI